MISNAELSDAIHLLIDLGGSDDADLWREHLCYFLIRGAKEAYDLLFVVKQAAWIQSIAKRDEIWLAAILAGEQFKKGDWYKNRESVIDLMEMDAIHKKYAGKRIE